jgi:4-amino-4-deoxy-L-arabinose transferase-like glycosyltransferase
MDITTGETEIKDSAPDALEASRQPVEHSKNYFVQHFWSLGEGITLLGLTLAALIPRIILATQLDQVTDEGTYIIAGKIDLALITHFRIIANQWNFNYEHPPVVKLLIGLAIYLNAHLGHLVGELLAARTPSILSGTFLVIAIYWLGRAPFGRVIALLAALCLAVSPWLVYFSALAYLDATMTTLITIAYLLFWPAIRQPRLYILSAILVGLGVASKYTAALAIPGMVLFVAYYFFLLRPSLPAEQRPPFPWLWWTGAIIISPITFLIADPAIWPHPLGLLIRSFRFEWDHAEGGHLTFLAGRYSLHVPHWAILYIAIAKMSAFVTIPAACFIIFALIQLFRFHLRKANLPITEVTSIAFLFIWLVSILGMFSLLNIVVGTHYLLPMAPPIALAGAFAWVTLFRYRRGALFHSATTSEPSVASLQTTGSVASSRPSINRRAAAVLALLTLFLVGPHLVGLVTVYGAEGYTSEFFNGENNVLQEAYPAYREAGLWLLAHTHGPGKVGLVAIIGTIVGPSNEGSYDVSWYTYNHDLQGRLKFIEVQPDDRTFPDDYLIWPMHLVQRGYTIPEPWHSHIVHIIMGGNTTYCFIMARNPATIT